MKEESFRKPGGFPTMSVDQGDDIVEIKYCSSGETVHPTIKQFSSNETVGL